MKRDRQVQNGQQHYNRAVSETDQHVTGKTQKQKKKTHAQELITNNKNIKKQYSAEKTSKMRDHVK